MTPREMQLVRDKIVACWPASAGWPDASWDIWWDELRPFPYTLVEYVLRAASGSQWSPSPTAVSQTCAEHARRRARNAAIREGADQW